MRIAVLGPLEVTTDDLAPVPVPGGQERLLLAALTARAPDVVDVDRLVRALWDGDPPDAPREALHAVVVRLRGHLEPGLPINASGRYVLRRGQGYALAVARSDVDALRSSALAARGSAQLAAGDASDAVRLLTTALGLWRGEPYADWPDAEFAVEERRRLAGLRAEAEAALTDARHRLAEQEPRTAAPEQRPAASVKRPLMPAAAVPAPPLWSRPEPPARPSDPFEPPAPEPAAVEPDAIDRGAVAAGPRPAPQAPPRRAGRPFVLAAVLVAALVAAALAVRSQQRSESAARTAEAAAVITDANRLATLSSTAGPLDLVLLLAVEAFRVADTPETRGQLVTALAEHARVERVARFPGVPQDPLLSGGGRTLTFRSGGELWAWSIERGTQPRVVIDIPADWGTWLTAASFPLERRLMVAGVDSDVSWLRTIDVADGGVGLMLEAEQVGGYPMSGVVSRDNAAMLLLVSEPDTAAPDTARWHVVRVDTASGAVHNTGVSGTYPARFDELVADFSDDAGTFVLWHLATSAPGTLVDLETGQVTPLPHPGRFVPQHSFRALPSGAAQLWDQGPVTLYDRSGAAVQEVDVGERVLDVAVSPDASWAVTVGEGGEVLRWDVDPSGQWSGPEGLLAHNARVVGVEVGPSGQDAVTVSMDQTAVHWDMRPADSIGHPPREPGLALDAACSIVGRDFTEGEWERYVPDRPYRRTCSELD